MMDDFEVDDVVQRALDRLTLLAEATTALSSTLNPYEGLRRVCRILVPQLADWCAVDLLEESGRPRRVCVHHRDPGVLPFGGMTGLLPPLPEAAAGPLARVLGGTGPLLVHGKDLPAPGQAVDPLHARQLELFDQLGTDTAIVAPLRARRQVLGALTIARNPGRPALAGDDLPMVEDLAHRIALALDNSRLHRETQHIAERLQLSLLPALPTTGPFEMAARYAPAATTAEVGGDWYDSFPLPTGPTTLIIGDVTGHDLRAAVTMSQLRNMLRGISCDRQEPPGQILHRLDLAHHTLYPQATATCIYALLDKDSNGAWTLDHSSAGHPPPLLITHEGDTRYLDGGRGLLLGVDPDLPRTHGTDVLPARSTVVFYTDGLIERRSEGLDAGLTRLRQHAAALAREPLDTFCDELINGLAADHADDVALLTARVPAPSPVRH
ncbi:SpoIIE family protein phosphatase [Streptomyces sp. ICN988]|uniref:PP2C family protein-serine/threonine phosphatase n=1 Tax=Streptomyces sp. ICN988 TaxID=2983765 RepID=UPI0021E45623|nr:GAF domain-containing SpoIIE family protein phosphatase [Streptomyces sp. ICN988]MCV2458161.1 SpoIIE family protein phosphatase [Streptomyces sp. ICN988]